MMHMNKVFRSTMKICFPNAEIIADKFHVLQLVNKSMETVRKEIQKLFYTHRKKYFKKSS